MSLEKEATVRARLDGLEDVTGGAQKVNSAWSEAGASISKSFKGAAGAVGEAVSGIVSDLGHVVTAAGAISFAGSLQQVHQLEDSVARMGVGARRSVQSVQDGINDLSDKINELPNSTAAWISSVGKLTYSYEGAAAAAKGAAEYGAYTGQAIGEVQALTVAVEQLTGATGKSGQVLQVLIHQADQLKTVGGAKALGDEVQHLQTQLSQLSSGDSLEKATALLAGLGGPKGFTPQQRERATGALLSRIESNPEGFERFLGHKITDEFGHVQNVTGVLEELANYAKRGKGQQLRSEFTFGKEATALLTHTDFDAIRRAQGLGATGEGESALERLKNTPAGQRQAAAVGKSVSVQDVVGHGSFIGDVSDFIGSLAASHPVLTTVGAVTSSKLLGVGLKSALSGGGAAAQGGAAAAAAEGGAGSLAAGLGLAGTGAVATLLGGVLATGETLKELGAASAAKQGFTSKALGYKDAETIAAQAKAAEAEAASHRSPGVQAALEAERRRITAARTPVAEIHEAQNPQLRAAIDGLVKAGASLQLATETATRLLEAAQASGQPVKIEVTDNTASRVHHHVRGHQ